jgi:hypothetical protein
VFGVWEDMRRLRIVMIMIMGMGMGMGWRFALVVLCRCYKITDGGRYTDQSSA